MDKNIHIDNMRSRLGVTLGVISMYNNEHNAVRNADILNNREMVLALLHMLSMTENDDVIKKYCEQTDMNCAEPEKLVEKYKVQLLAAMIYDRAFYAMAINYKQAIAAGLSVTAEKKENIIRFPRGNKYSGRTYKTIIASAACIALILSFAILLRLANPGYGEQIDKNNAWFLSLKGSEDTRIDLVSPIFEMAMSTETEHKMPQIRGFTKAIRKDKNNAGLYVNRGVALTLNGYLDSAVKDFDKAIELDPDSASAYYNRAIANAGKDTEAAVVIADLETSIMLDPAYKEASYYAIGSYYYYLYKNDDTKPDYMLQASISAFSVIKSYKDVYNVLDYLERINP
ncbi:MAG: tetratricopeptide repeat protein [Treponema sp.]|nr:tetratricopeptide repeat protein [Treponema sp.]